MSEIPSSWQGRIQALEGKVTELVERNRKLANQVVGMSDRMRDAIKPLLAEARRDALNEAADAMDADPEFRDPLRLKSDWLRNRASQ